MKFKIIISPKKGWEVFKIKKQETFNKTGNDFKDNLHYFTRIN